MYVYTTTSEQFQKMTEELKVDKTSLSSTRRKKTSATDDRPSSASMGAVAVAFMGAVFGAIVLMDLSSLAKCFARKMKVKPTV